MTEPVEIPSPSAPAPFQPEAARQPAGCSRPVLIGCGIVFLLLGVAAVAFLFKAKDLLAWTLGRMQSEIVAALPADVTEGERARLDAAFAGATRAVRDGEFATDALQKLQSQLVVLAEKAPKRQITRQDVLDLTAALEAVARVPAPAPVAEPAPAPEAVPAPPAAQAGPARPAPAPAAA